MQYTPTVTEQTPAMASPPSPPPAPPPSNPARLVAAIDMGTNSFKLLLARAHSGRFVPLHRLKSPVALGRRRLPDGSLPLSSQLRALSALRSFSLFLRTHPDLLLTRAVATSAVRSAPNRSDLIDLIKSDQEVDFPIEVLSGEEEARLIYLGILQFLPIYDKTALAVDIGGGSTEFVIGNQGKVLFAASLDLGHVSLTESFVEKGNLEDLRRHIRAVINQSPVVEKVKEFGFEVAVGSSGTIRSIEKAVGFGNEVREFSREWSFSREELATLVEKISTLESGEVERLGFSKRRGEVRVAGAVLLLEIFEALGIDVMEVSGYGLGEGVVAEMLASGSKGYGLNVNARWRSVVGLAMRFDGENRMKSVGLCIGIAKDIFEGIRMCDALTDEGSKSAVCLEEKDFEYVEAAILLHNVGKVMGTKKGYHKQSYQIIKHGGHLHGYSSEEIELVSLLARFHRKKFPRCGHETLREFSVEMKQKFRVLCVIVRLCLVLQQCQCFKIQGVEVKHTQEGFKLVLCGLKDQLLLSHDRKLTSAAVKEEIQPELDHFEEVFQQKICLLTTE